jgi:hypothetical protein
MKTNYNVSMRNLLYDKILIGSTYGRLKVINKPFRKYNVSKHCEGKYHVTCVCTCGNTKDVMLTDLGNGTSSCGCYRRELKQKGSFLKDGFKKCANCLSVKPQEDFSLNNHCKDKVASSCRACMKSKDLQKKYGITLEEYNHILKEQNYGCAICGKNKTNKRSLAVDHCHRTKQIRGLLCELCNTLLGKLGDNKKEIKLKCDKLISYLNEEGEKCVELICQKI